MADETALANGPNGGPCVEVLKYLVGGVAALGVRLGAVL